MATALHVEDRADAAFLGRLAAVGAAAGAALGAVVLVAGHEVFGSDVFFGQITRLGASDRLTRPWAHANVAAMAIGASAAGVSALGSLRARVVIGATLVAALVATASRAAPNIMHKRRDFIMVLRLDPGSRVGFVRAQGRRNPPR